MLTLVNKTLTNRENTTPIQALNVFAVSGYQKRHNANLVETLSIVNRYLQNVQKISFRLRKQRTQSILWLQNVAKRQSIQITILPFRPFFDTLSN